MNNIKPYPKYKPSGIAWLGDIPEHWEVRKLKYSLQINNGADFRHIQSDTGYPVIGSGGQFAFAKNYMFDGEVVFLGRKGTIDKPLYFKGKFWAVDTMFYAKAKFGNNVKFHFYVATQIPFKLYSTSTALPSMTQADLKEHLLAYAPLPEQSKIANFLDFKLSKIDRFIRKKKQLIKLLNEQKAGIINHAVTKGLDTNAKMKPSGIEWLGDIPEHWEVRKLKYIAEIYPSNVDKYAKENEKTVRLCNYTDVYKNNYITNDMDLMVATASDEQIEKFTLLINDVIITKDSETANDIAVPAVVKENLENVVCGYHLSVMRPNDKILGEFLFRLLQSKTINIQFEVNANGVTRVGLGTYSQKNPKVPIPPIAEQQEIIDFILNETQTITATISTIEKEIALVEEYKTSLIAEAVTGKIDVRDFEIPETVEEESYEELEEDMNIAAEEEAEYGINNIG